MNRLTPPLVKGCRVQDTANKTVLVAHTFFNKKNNNWNLNLLEVIRKLNMFTEASVYFKFTEVQKTKGQHSEF